MQFNEDRFSRFAKKTKGMVQRANKGDKDIVMRDIMEDAFARMFNNLG